MDRRIRVLWLIKGLGPGGAEQLLVTAAGVRDRDRFAYEVAYLLPWKDHLVPRLQGFDVPVRCLEVRDERNVSWAVALRRLLAATPFDVVHLHSPYVAGIARLVVRSLPAAKRPALVSTEHNIWSSFLAATRLLNAWTGGLDDVRLAVSEDVRASMASRLRPSVEVIAHGVDREAVRAGLAGREEVRRWLGVRPGEVLVGTVGNYRPQKAYPDLLAAARRVKDSGQPIRFVAVGQGPQEDQIKRLHAELGLQETFKLLGYRSDAVEIMAGCDLFTLASEHEGLPVALMEALVLGLPVVATEVGGIPEAVTDRSEGLLVAPHRPDLLAEGLAELAADPARRARMAEAASSRGRQFDIRRTVRRTEEHYDQLAGDATRREPGRDPARE